MPSLVLCAHHNPVVAERLREAYDRLAPGEIVVESFTNGRELHERAEAAAKENIDIPLIFSGLDLDELDGVALLCGLQKSPDFSGSRKVLLATAEQAESADTLLQCGALHGRLDPDFEDETLQRLNRNLLTDFVVHSAPHLIDDLHPLLDLRLLANGFSKARDNLRQLNKRLKEVERSVIAVDGMSDDRVEEAMIDEFDRLLERPERHRYSAGETMVREGEDPGTIWIILSGRVQLFRTIDGEDVTFHSESAGRIVGLMSLSLQDPIFFSCRAVTPTTSLVLSRAEVSDAIHRSPALSNYLITVILRSMARRNRRSAQLLVKVRQLNQRLSVQRDELTLTLDELRATQECLVDSTKMATLGNLAAGMAHELNNPVAAILHASEHLSKDLESLLASTPDLAVAAAALPAAQKIASRSTRDERRIRDQLVRELDIDSRQATKLVSAGIESRADFEHYASFAAKASKEQVIHQLGHAGQIGTALRNTSNCSHRIAALVRSLKIYARSDEDQFEKIDLNGTLDDVQLILANRLRDVEIVKNYGDLPSIKANSSQLQQVWTNLISNAIQAMGEKGELSLTTSAPRPGWLRVQVEDNGAGIPEEAQAHLFEARFTTRSGRVEFGLGLGLPISQNIIHRHGGEICFVSQPGRTIFTVDLPETPPDITEPNDQP